MGKEELNYIATITSQNVSNKYNEDIGFMNTPEGMLYADGGQFVNAETRDLNVSVDYTDLGDVNDIYAINDDNFYSATGRSRRRRRRTRRSTARMQRRKARADARNYKKRTEAQAQLESARALNRGAEADIALARSVGGGTGGKKGLSTGAIVGIVLGGLAVVGLVAYMVIKKKGK